MNHFVAGFLFTMHDFTLKMKGVTHCHTIGAPVFEKTPQVTYRVPLQWTKSEQVPSRVPLLWTNCEKVPLGVLCQWTKCDTVQFRLLYMLER